MEGSMFDGNEQPMQEWLKKIIQTCTLGIIYDNT